MPVVIKDFQVLGSDTDQPVQRSELPKSASSSKDQSWPQQERDLTKLLRHIKVRQSRIHAD